MYMRLMSVNVVSYIMSQYTYQWVRLVSEYWKKLFPGLFKIVCNNSARNFEAHSNSQTKQNFPMQTNN